MAILKHYTAFACFILAATCAAQVNVTNNGVVITNAGGMFINGSYANNNTGLLDNKGNITITENITNNATTGFTNNTAGKIHLTGSNPVIDGSQPLNFYQLSLNTTGTLTLMQHINVSDTLAMLAGNLYLNGNTINLSNTGYVHHEGHLNRIYGETGKILYNTSLTAPLLQQNIGGLGLYIQSAAALGNVQIERMHAQQPAGDTAIYRYYRITAQYPVLVDCVASAYFNAERNKDEKYYRIFTKSVNAGTGWENRSGSVSIPDKMVTSSIKFRLDTLLITIASENCLQSPDLNVQGFTTVKNLQVIDTLTCAKPVSNLAAYANAQNIYLHWQNPAGDKFNNPLQTPVANTYLLHGVQTQTGCANSVYLTVSQNKIPPLMDAVVDSLKINCSAPQTQLQATAISPNTALNWSNKTTGYTSPNPAKVTQAGWYYVTATRLENGCTKQDSVKVSYNPLIDLVTSPDTVICPHHSITLRAQALGSALTNVHYTWSSGSNTQLANVLPPGTTAYTVNVNADNNCAGSHTIHVKVPVPLTDSTLAIKDCKQNIAGTIALYAKNGIPPYYYSIDNGATYQANGNFYKVPYGNYHTVVKDSLGCFKYNYVMLNALSTVLKPAFIASTKNYKGDTLVLVDVTNPRADSIKWALPLNTHVIGGDKYNAIITAKDTGNFMVTLTSYFQNCTYTTTKNVYFLMQDTTMATPVNNNGIKQVTVYPNPNDGLFTVKVEFYKKQNASLQIWSAGMQKQQQFDFSGVDYLEQPVNLTNVNSGTYILRVIGEYNSKHIQFIILK